MRCAIYTRIYTDLQAEVTFNSCESQEEKIKAFKKGMNRFPKNVNTQEEIEQYKETRLDSDVLVLAYSVTVNEKEMSNSEFFNIPTITGWGRSKLKVLREKNDLPFKTDEWKNKPVKVHINKDGYLRLLE